MLVEGRALHVAGRVRVPAPARRLGGIPPQGHALGPAQHLGVGPRRMGREERARGVAQDASGDRVELGDPRDVATPGHPQTTVVGVLEQVGVDHPGELRPLVLEDRHLGGRIPLVARRLRRRVGLPQRDDRDGRARVLVVGLVERPQALRRQDRPEGHVEVEAADAPERPGVEDRIVGGQLPCGGVGEVHAVAAVEPHVDPVVHRRRGRRASQLGRIDVPRRRGQDRAVRGAELEPGPRVGRDARAVHAPHEGAKGDDLPRSQDVARSLNGGRLPPSPHC